MTWHVLSIVALALATLPASFAVTNLIFFYRRLPRVAPGDFQSVGYIPLSTAPAVSVLIPARNEGNAIEQAIRCVLRNTGVEFEVVVLDDHSTDRTAGIVDQIALHDPRVRLATGATLPQGWCGKQHACHQLSKLAMHDVLVFIDADVRLSADALVRISTRLARGRAGLISGVPRQVTGTVMEKMVIPLIQFVLLGYLPMAFMRWTNHPAFGAGCGQLFASRRKDYEKVGGHGAVRASLHDGITLPRAFRRAGVMTDLFDASDLASCRMYHSAAQVWRGLAKNATEAMASPLAILPWTALLLGAGLLPVALAVGLAMARVFGEGGVGERDVMLACVAAVISLLMPLVLALRLGQSVIGALLHPAGVTVLLVIQWSALMRKLAGRPMSWKGRDYTAPGGR